MTASFSSHLARSPGQDDTVDSSICYGAVADLCLVDIDPETYEVAIRGYWTVHDSGRILNPLLADGQVMGALAHGVGGALYEELVFDRAGTPLATSFADYLCPTAREIPEVHIHHRHGETPFVPSGARGIGEGNSMSAPAAVANAIADALSERGVEITELPVHGSKIWKWLQETATAR